MTLTKEKRLKLFLCIELALLLFSSLGKSAENQGGHSVAPIVGYEPTYRFVAGAAYFFETTDLNLGVDLYTNFNEVYQSHVKFYYSFLSPWSFRVYLGGIRGYDPYYGEGGETLAFQTQLWGSRFYNDTRLEYALNKIITFSLISDYRIRKEESHGDPLWPRYFPDEIGLAFGLGFDIDTTAPKKTPKNGFKFSSKVLYAPNSLSTVSTSDFVLTEHSLSVYQEILTELSNDIVAAYRIKAGYTFGNPTYIFKYRLGGSDGLAGYYDNRFRGRIYYVHSTEIRYPIWKLFSGAVSIGFGDITDENFTRPKLAYGLGLRIGLPPDYISKVRIDFLFGKDQQGIFVDFGDTF